MLTVRGMRGTATKRILPVKPNCIFARKNPLIDDNFKLWSDLSISVMTPRGNMTLMVIKSHISEPVSMPTARGFPITKQRP